MANYYYVTIKSDKMTQEIANEIFNAISEKNRVRSFDFIEAGVVRYNTRGLTDITEILNKYDFTDEEIEVKDEFTYAYENMMTPDEAVVYDLKEVLKHIEHLKEHTELSEKIKNIETTLTDIVCF